MKVGIVGWRGMVGSVLMQRMLEENDLAGIEPVFFSTSQAGQEAPMGAGILKSADDLAALSQLDVIITCQVGDYTKSVHPALRNSGWSGYWIDAASTLRMEPNAVITTIDADFTGSGFGTIGGLLEVGTEEAPASITVNMAFQKTEAELNGFDEAATEE